MSRNRVVSTMHRAFGGAFALLVACSDASEAASVTPDATAPPVSIPAPDASPENSSKAEPVAEAGTPDASPPDVAPRAGLSIKFDYRFDSAGFFSAPERRRSLEAAAAVWSSVVKDEFDIVPKGTYAISRNPERYEEPAQPVTLDHDIDGILIFVASADLPDNLNGKAAVTAGIGQVSDPQLKQQLRERFDGKDFEPWTGWIAFRRDAPWYFDTAPTATGTVPPDNHDFVSVALHEIGHVLGVGQAKAFDDLIVGTEFTGPTAVSTHGGNVPMASDRSHVPNTVSSGGKEMLMDPSHSKGKRTFPTALDLALLKDIGYEL